MEIMRANQRIIMIIIPLFAGVAATLFLPQRLLVATAHHLALHHLASRYLVWRYLT